MKIRTDRRFYEGTTPAGKTTYVTFQYDDLGRLTKRTDSADIGLDDDIVETTEYADCPSTYALAEPVEVVLADGHGTVLRRGTNTVDCSTGLVSQARAYIDAQSFTETDTTYYPNGNIQSVLGPANVNGQRFQVVYSYDAETATYPTSITDSFGYVSTNTYNLKHGLVVQSTDPNQSTTSYTYDVFGRVTSIRMPYEQGGGAPTVSFEYHHDAAVPWAITQRLGARETVVFEDGLGQVIQSKDLTTLHTGPNSTAIDVMVVSGKKTLDLTGRVSEERYPVVEPLGSAGTFNPSVDSAPPEVTTYDVADRVLTKTHPDGAAWSYSYDFAPDGDGAMRLRTGTYDPNGVLRNTYHDVRGLVTSVEERNDGGSEVVWTSYGYDAMKDVTSIIDDQGNITFVIYDNLGRRTDIQSPDAGTTHFVYDPASNLIGRVTSNLAMAGEAIVYDYEYNRLTDVVYPQFPENGIHYTYGAPFAPDNGAGQIVRVDDSSGYELRSYGQLDEIETVVRQIEEKPSRGGDVLGTYTSHYAHDSFGRLLATTYPDGEVVTYTYDSGDRVQSVSGVKGAHAYDYATRMEYDKFGTLVFSLMGNGVETVYKHDPLSRDLEKQQAGKGGSSFQNVSYTYDPAGNMLSLTNNVPVSAPSQYGGPSVQSFTYDDLHRLVAAEGSYQFAPGKLRTYTLSLAYDTIHSITQKSQTDILYNSPKKAVVQQETTYDNTYMFNGPQPHAVTNVDGRTFTYDANGNQLGWQSDSSGQHREIVWNEDDRIESIEDGGALTFFQYN
ncbi:MAG: hypothetical protein R3F14_44775, partial [Polyangiaceae bacterium]